MWAKWTSFYNRAKSANAGLSLFERAWRLCAVIFGSAVLAWASRTWDWYWNTFSWAGVAFAFLVSCIGLALAFFLSGLGVHLWRRRTLNLSTTPTCTKKELANPSVHFPTPHWHEPLKPIVTKHFRNETVELDGKSFIDCTFENVTFAYQGTMPSQFTNCSIVNHNRGYIFESRNPVVQVTSGIIHSLRASTGLPETVQLTLNNKEDQ